MFLLFYCSHKNLLFLLFSYCSYCSLLSLLFLLFFIVSIVLIVLYCSYCLHCLTLVLLVDLVVLIVLGQLFCIPCSLLRTIVRCPYNPKFGVLQPSFAHPDFRYVPLYDCHYNIVLLTQTSVCYITLIALVKLSLKRSYFNRL